MAGAAVLAARAALQGGAGRVYLVPLDAALRGALKSAPGVVLGMGTQVLQKH